VEWYDFKSEGTSRVETRRKKMYKIVRDSLKRNQLQEAEGK